MLIGHYNINSIRNKFSDMKYVFDLCTIDIFGILETKLDDSFPLSQFLSKITSYIARTETRCYMSKIQYHIVLSKNTHVRYILLIISHLK